jgi:succinate dehydrogenase hydrophobic anchor subunit
MNHLWLLQRISAFFILAFLPSIFYSVVEWTKLDMKVLPYWFTLGRGIVFGVFINAILTHSFLGLEIVIQDYVPADWKEKILALSKWLHIILGVLAWFFLIILIIMGSKK